MPTQIQEAAKVARHGPGKVLLTIITPGQGSSGYYSPETIAKAAAEKAFPAGSLGMVNHDSLTEREERPEGDLRNLVLALNEDAYVNEDGALVAEARIASAWASLVDEFHDVIGASISASASVRDTKEGRIVERLIPNPFNRVDLVTVPGRGGKTSALLEAARVVESRSIVVDETTSSDVRNYVRYAVTNAHADRENDEYVWFQDHDDDYAYFEKRGTSYRQAYTRDGVNVTLNGEPEPVLRRTEYDPVAKESAVSNSNRIVTLDASAVEESLDRKIKEAIDAYKPPASAGQDPSPAPAEETKKSIKEIPMAEIAEERLQVLEESHGRVPALEAKVTAAEERAATAERRAAVAESTVRARDFAKTIITSANSELSESVVARIVDASTGTIPLDESLKLDTDALTETVNKAREAEETYLAKLAKENGIGQVRGISGTTSNDVAEASTADIRNAMKGA